MVDAGLFDDLMARIDDGDVQLTGQGGFLPEMVPAVLERGPSTGLSESPETPW
jgi:putative transposase